MNPLQVLGKWFDSLWEDKHTEPHVSVTQSIVNDSRRMTIRERIEDACTAGSDTIAILKVTQDKTNLMGYDFNSSERFAFYHDGKYVRVCNMNVYLGHPDAMGHHCLDDEWVKRNITAVQNDKYPYHFDVSFKTYGVEIPRFIGALAKESISRSKPHTAQRGWRGHYFLPTDAGYVRWTDTSQDIGMCGEWVYDLHVWDANQEDDKKDRPPFVITSIDDVDYKLLPHTHWRRWIRYSEVSDSSKDWTLRYVPRQTFTGKIRYFRIDINFDAANLGRMPVNVGNMLYLVFARIQKACDKDLNETKLLKPCDPVPFNHHVQDVKSNVYIDFGNITVKHKEVQLSLTGYIKCQVKPVFQDNNPYLNPVHGSVDYDDNYFYFTNDFKVATCHRKDIVGDKIPDAK